MVLVSQLALQPDIEAIHNRNGLYAFDDELHVDGTKGR